MSEKNTNLRERTRKAVQREVGEAANALFAERGFEATTIEDIASAVGMSQSSVFRYFGTKEELVLGKFDYVADDMLAEFRARPAGEAPWTALHRMFDVMVAHSRVPGGEKFVAPIHRMIFGTPALLAGYLQKLQHLQDAVVAELRERAEATGKPYAADDPAPEALTAAAFGCLVAAQRSWLASGAKGPFAGAVERAMAAVGPAS